MLLWSLLIITHHAGTVSALFSRTPNPGWKEGPAELAKGHKRPENNNRTFADRRGYLIMSLSRITTWPTVSGQKLVTNLQNMVSVALLVARQTSNRKVASSIPANAVCFTVWQVTAWGKLSAVAGHHSFFRAVRSWSLRLSALMDSDLAWVNGKSAR